MKKRSFAIVLAAAMMTGLVACGGQSSTSTAGSTSDESSAGTAEQAVTIKLGYTHGNNNPEERNQLLDPQIMQYEVEKM